MYAAIWEKDDRGFTYLKKIFDAINDVQKRYNWLITDCECYPHDKALEKLLSNEYIWIDGERLTECINTQDFQWIWGCLAAFDKNEDINNILKYPLPYAFENGEIWIDVLKPQHPLSCIEIIAWDSACVKILARDKRVIDDFLNMIPLAERL